MDPPPPSFPPTASSPQPLPRKSPLVPPPIHHLNGNQGSPHHLGLSKAAKRRVRVACIQCKLSKVRCDDTRPCRRCVKRHMADMCVDAHQKPRGRKRSEDGMFISTSPSSTHKHAFLSPSSHGSHPYSPRPGSGRNSPAPSPSSAPLRRASPLSHNRNTSFGSMNTYQQKFVYSPSPLVQSLSLASAERSSSMPIVSNNSGLRIHLSPPTQGSDSHSPASLARQALEYQQQQQAALESSQQQMFNKFSFPDMSKGPHYNQNYNVGFPSLLTATSSYAGTQSQPQSHSDPSQSPVDAKPLYGDSKMVSSPPAGAGSNLLLGSNPFDPVLAAQLAALGQQNMRSFDGSGSIKMEGQPPQLQQFQGPPALNMSLITQHNQSYMVPQPHPVGFMGSPQQSLPSFLQLAQGPPHPGMTQDSASLWNAVQQQMGQDPTSSPHNQQSADASAWSYLRAGPGFDGDGPVPMAQTTPMNGGPTPTHGPGMTRSGSSEMIADMNSSLDALFSAPPSSAAAQSSDLAMQMMGMAPPPFDISAFRPSPQSSPAHGDHSLPSPSSAPPHPMLNPAHFLGSSLRMRSEFLHPRSPASESYASEHDSVRTHTPLPPGATRAASYSHSVSDSGYANDPALASLPSLSAHALRLHDPSTPRPESSSPVAMIGQQPHSGSSGSPMTSPHLRNFDVASPSKSPFHNPPSNTRAHSCSSLPAGAGDSASNAMLNFPSSPESFVTDSTPHSFNIQLELPGSALDQSADQPTIKPLFRDAHSIST